MDSVRAAPLAWSINAIGQNPEFPHFSLLRKAHPRFKNAGPPHAASLRGTSHASQPVASLKEPKIRVKRTVNDLA